MEVPVQFLASWFDTQNHSSCLAVLTMQHGRLKGKDYVSNQLNILPPVSKRGKKRETNRSFSFAFTSNMWDWKSSVSLEADWLRALNHSNDMAGDSQQGLKVLLLGKISEVVSWTIHGPWSAVSHILFIRTCLSAAFSFSVCWLSERQAAELACEQCPCLHLTCI